MDWINLAYHWVRWPAAVNIVVIYDFRGGRVIS